MTVAQKSSAPRRSVGRYGRSAGWTSGVNRDGGTYSDFWDAAERTTYSLNHQSRDRDGDGHACE